VVSLLTGVLFGLAPAFQAARVDLASALKEEGSAVAGGSHARLRRLLVVAQMALSLLLLIGSGLFIRSLLNLRKQDPGFRTGNVIAFSVDPRLSGYTREQGRIFYQQLLDRLGGLPGVEVSSLALVRVLDFGEWDSTVTVEGYDAKPGEDMNPFYNAVSPGYFTTLGMPILAGRDFSSADTLGANKVGIVNEKFARHFFGDRNPVGRHFGFGGDPGTKTDIEIIGVVKDAKYESLRDEIPRQVFQPYQQRSSIPGMTVYVRSRVEPHQMGAAVRSAVRELDTNLPIFDMRTLDEQLDLSLVFERMVAALATVFAFLATLLAAIGLYAVMAFNVARRTREIGVRMALGATNSSVAWMVMNETLFLLGAGVLIGLPCAWGLSRLVQAQLFGITPNDPLSIGLATSILAIIAAASGYLPALRATHIDPIRALRHE
jgi:predicted permease